LANVAVIDLVSAGQKIQVLNNRRFIQYLSARKLYILSIPTETEYIYNYM